MRYSVSITWGYGCFGFSIVLIFVSVEKEPNMLKVKEPVVIIGDIHGQYYDMIHMFEKVIDPRGLP